MSAYTYRKYSLKKGFKQKIKEKDITQQSLVKKSLIFTKLSDSKQDVKLKRDFKYSNTVSNLDLDSIRITKFNIIKVMCIYFKFVFQDHMLYKKKEKSF